MQYLVFLTIMAVFMINFALTVKVHFELIRMLDAKSETLAEAGINSVNWWFRCIRGVLLLAFGQPGKGLPSGKLRMFRAFVISQLAALLLVLAFLYSPPEAGKLWGLDLPFG